MTARPRGRFDPELQITICTDLDYQAQVIHNIAHEMRTEKAGALEERDIGDCVIVDRGTNINLPPFAVTFRAPSYKVKIGGMWARFDTREAALDFVREVRAEQKAAA